MPKFRRISPQQIATLFRSAAGIATKPFREAAREVVGAFARARAIWTYSPRRGHNLPKIERWADWRIESIRPRDPARELWFIAQVSHRAGITPERDIRMQKAIQAASKRSRQERIEVEPSFVPKAQRRAVEWSGALHWAGLSLSLESAQLCASLGVREPVAAAFKVQPFGDDWETQLAWFKTLEDMAETPLCLRGGDHTAVEKWREARQVELFSRSFNSPDAHGYWTSQFQREPLGEVFAAAMVIVAEHGDTELLQKWMKKAIDCGRPDLLDGRLSSRYRDGMTPYMAALAHADLEAARLLAPFADPNARETGDDARTGLMLLCQWFPQRKTPLHDAELCAQFAIERMSDEALSARDSDGESAVWSAARAGMTAVVARLLERGVGVEGPSSHPGALFVAAQSSPGSVEEHEALSRFLAKHCDVNARLEDGLGACAAVLTRPAISEEEKARRFALLVELGVDPDARDSNGETALHELLSDRFLDFRASSAEEKALLAREVVARCDSSIRGNDGLLAFEKARPVKLGAMDRLMLWVGEKPENPAWEKEPAAAVAREMARGLARAGLVGEVEKMFASALARRAWKLSEALSEWAPKELSPAQLGAVKTAPSECRHLRSLGESQELRAIVREPSPQSNVAAPDMVSAAAPELKRSGGRKRRL